MISDNKRTKSGLISNTEVSHERLPLIVLGDVPSELQRVDIALVPKE